MADKAFVLGYVTACTSGKLPLSECDPVWQLGIIAALLVVAIVSLVALQLHSRMRST